MNFLLAAGFFAKLGAFFTDMLPQFCIQLVVMVIFVPLYLLFMGIALIGLFAETVFKKLAGIDTIYLNGTAFDGASGNGQDLVFAFITEPAVQNVFISIVALSFVLLFIFTIVAMIKSEFALDLKGSAKSPIIGRALKSLVNFIVVPITALIAVIGTNFLTKTIYDMFGGDSATIATKCFHVGAYDANRVRRGDMEFLDHLTSGEYLEGGTNPFTGSQEQVAEKIDQAFLRMEEHRLQFKKRSFGEKLDDTAEGKYVAYQTLLLTYPEPTYFSIWQLDEVNYFYNLMRFDYVLGIGSAVVMAWTLLSVCLVLVKRVFELTILFLLAPAMTSIAPLDGGQAEKKWRQEFMKRLLAVIAPVFAYNMYFLLLPLFEGISLFGGTTVGLISDFTLIFNIFFELVCILTGLSVVKSASALLSNLLGIEDLVKSGGEAAKKAVDLGKKAALGATAMGGVAVKGVAAVAKGAKNLGSRVANSKAVGDAKKFINKKADEGNVLAKAARGTGKGIKAAGKFVGDTAKKGADLGKKALGGVKSAAKSVGGAIKKGTGYLGLSSEDNTEEIKGYDEKLNDRVDENGNIIAGGAGLNTQVEQAKDKMDSAKAALDKEDSEENKEAYENARKAYNAKKAERDEIAEKRADAVKRGQSAFGSAYEEEFGENSKDTGFMAKLATSYNNKIKSSKLANVPFLGERLKKTANSFQELFAIDGGTATRRLNDALAGLFGDGGGGDLWKINFNKNARAGLYEGVPESKKRESGIQQGLLMGAREKYEKEEKEKQQRASEEKILRRMLGASTGMEEYASLIKKREEATNPTEIKKLDAKIEKMEVQSGLAGQASRYYDDIAKGDTTKAGALKRYKEQMEEEARQKSYKSEQTNKAKMKASIEATGGQYEEKMAESSVNQLAQAIANALGSGKGVKLNKEDTPKVKLDKNSSVTIDKNSIAQMTEGFTSVAETLRGLAEALKELNGGGDSGGDKK